MPKELLMLLGKKTTIIKRYNAFFVKAVLDVNTFILLWIPPIFVSGVFTWIQNLCCLVIHQYGWDLTNSCCTSGHSSSCGTQMDGWTDGLWVEEKSEVAFYSNGGLSSSIECWIYFSFAGWCWQIYLFLGAFYPVPKIEVVRSLAAAVIL